MKTQITLTLLSLFVGNFCVSAADGSKRIPLLEKGDLSIHLWVKNEASAADQEWIGFEIINKGDEAVPVGDLHYRMETESGQSLPSGSTPDLMPHCWEGEPSPEKVIPPGVYRVTKHPSRYAPSLLGADGLGAISASVYFMFRFENDRELKTPVEGIPFSFQWNKPDAQGVVKMKAEPMELLENPEESSMSCHSYRLRLLLNHPEVGGDLTLDQLLAAINLRKGGFDGRETLVERLVSQSYDQEQISEFYEQRIPSGDRAVLDDLRGHPEVLWAPRFVPLLVPLTAENRWDILSVLDQHWEDWADNEEVRSAISSSVLASWSRLDGVPIEEMVEADDLYSLQSKIRELGMSRDPEVVPLLVPYLDQRLELHENRLHATSALVPSHVQIPYRLCDVALEAIWTIRSGTPHSGYPEPPPLKSGEREFQAGFSVDEIDAVRDLMIQELKEELF